MLAKLRAISRYYLIFHKYLGTRIFALAGLSFATTLTEGVGITLFFSLLSQLANTSTPMSPGLLKLHETLRALGLPPTPLATIGAMVGIFVMRGTLVLVQNSFQYRLYMELYGNITEDLVDALGKLRYPAYLEQNTGHYAHLMTKEVDRCMIAFYQVAALLPKSVAILTYLVLSLRFSLEFTFFAVVFGGALTLLFRAVNRITKNTAHRLSSAEANLTASLIQFAQSFKYLQASGSASKVQNRIVQLSRDVARMGSTIGKLGAIIPASSEPLLVAFISGCLYYQTAIRGAAVAPLLVAVAFLYRMMKEFTVVQGSWQTLMGHSSGVDRVLNALAEMRRSAEPHGGEQLKDLHKGLRFENISFQYGSRPILSDVSFEIPSGSMVAFIGESGAGKTTLVDLIVGLLTPQSGRIFYDNIESAQLDRRSFRQRIGYVTQEGVIFEDTVANNVTLGDEAEDASIWEALRGANASQFVEQTDKGLSERVGEKGVRLSGGQRQRLFLARELFKKPTLLILDEATSNLDSESEAQVQKVIEDWKGKVTVVVIAHRLSTVRNCDRIFVLEKGRIVESGTFDDLVVKSSVFKRMYELQTVQSTL